MVRLFIYGTLKRGHRAHALLAGQRFLGSAATLPTFRLLDLGSYPGLAEVGTGGERPGLAVEGEIWEVSETCMRQLDAYEGGEYVRREITVTGLDDSRPSAQSTVQAYVMKTPDWSRMDRGSRWDGDSRWTEGLG